jgi:hypothetical protein
MACGSSVGEDHSFRSLKADDKVALVLLQLRIARHYGKLEFAPQAR